MKTSHALSTPFMSDLIRPHLLIYVCDMIKQTGRSDEDIAQVRRWIERLYATLQQDWTQTSFRVRYTQSQEILVQFALPAAPNEKDSKQGGS